MVFFLCLSDVSVLLSRFLQRKLQRFRRSLILFGDESRRVYEEDNNNERERDIEREKVWAGPQHLHGPQMEISNTVQHYKLLFCYMSIITSISLFIWWNFFFLITTATKILKSH